MILIVRSKFRCFWSFDFLRSLWYDTIRKYS